MAFCHASGGGSAVGTDAHVGAEGRFAAVGYAFKLIVQAGFVFDRFLQGGAEFFLGDFFVVRLALLQVGSGLRRSLCLYPCSRRRWF